MHGTNLARSAENREDGALQVREVFYTIQGEGPNAGRPAVFVRLTGCNLRCWYCDTQWDDEKDKTETPFALAEKVMRASPAHCSLVVITGGEPLRQNLEPFLIALYRIALVFGRGVSHVQIETAGTLWQDCLLRSEVEIVVSPKTPKIHPLISEHAEAFKYVIMSECVSPDDGLPLYDTQIGVVKPSQKLARPEEGSLVPIYLSPCDEGAHNRNRENVEFVAQLAMKYGYRAGLQLHKIFNIP